MMMSTHFIHWRSRLIGIPCRDLDDGYRFYWILENEYRQRFETSLEYYVERDDLLSNECRLHLMELEELEVWFSGKEEFEKCAQLRDLGKQLRYEYRAYLSVQTVE